MPGFLPRHLWERRFQLAGIGNAGLPAVMAGIFAAQKSRYTLIMEGFWLGDKFRVRAETNHSARTIWYAGTPDRIGMQGRQNPNDLSKFADEYDISLPFVRQLSHEDIGSYPVEWFRLPARPDRTRYSLGGPDSCSSRRRKSHGLPPPLPFGVGDREGPGGDFNEPGYSL